ncbi:hypothetical protein C477_07718 [Haloterrigena salina JCM 13891]|uniref:DUF7344 domain-containing protein n=1 Tax=Haloterrigena salina JCM 13891 TaxID=1227488 RepID=M0C8J8_9EURY|nr:hypothetical protein [Haloterrigena salina]ELZ19540.1 hypothetical protein C477_07718 [Haloterrigena salina JCM 13891]
MEKNGDGSRNGGSQNRTATPSDAVDGARPDLDDHLRLLCERRRRYALYLMRERNAEELSVLARRVAAELAETTPDAVDETRRAEIETLFVHVDIPMLETANVVSHDRRIETLSLEDLPESLETALDACAAIDGIGLGDGKTSEETPNDPD